MPERFVTETIHDKTLDVSLRPSVFADFTGQRKVKERLELAVEAARQRKESLDHILRTGPPGLGKTTLAYILAKAMGANIVVTSGPALEKAYDLAGLLSNSNEATFCSSTKPPSAECYRRVPLSRDGGFQGGQTISKGRTPVQSPCICRGSR